MTEYASITKEGDRSINEDYIGNITLEGTHLFCLADGLGGHGKGEVASEIVVKESISAFKSNDKSDTLAKCFMQAQENLLKKQIKENSRDEMKSTLTLLLLKAKSALWGHVGDSRIYLFRKSKLFTRTLDHSVPQMLVSTGEINEKDIRFHEDRNRLIRVMGMEWNTPKYALSEEIATQSGDAFLLCSDGFWELIDEKEMSKLLKKSKSPEGWLSAMEEVVLKNGRGKNMDNYSATAIFIKG